MALFTGEVEARAVIRFLHHLEGHSVKGIQGKWVTVHGDNATAYLPLAHQLTMNLLSVVPFQCTEWITAHASTFSTDAAIFVVML